MAKNSVFRVKYHMTERMLGQSIPLRGATAEEEGGAVERLEVPKEPHPCPVDREEGGREEVGWLL